jgi:hypothetical protein
MTERNPWNMTRIDLDVAGFNINREIMAGKGKEAALAEIVKEWGLTPQDTEALRLFTGILTPEQQAEKDREEQKREYEREHDPRIVKCATLTEAEEKLWTAEYRTTVAYKSKLGRVEITKLKNKPNELFTENWDYEEADGHHPSKYYDVYITGEYTKVFKRGGNLEATLTNSFAQYGVNILMDDKEVNAHDNDWNQQGW